MLCDNCLKNTATVHMTTFVNGQVKTVHLCGQCAAKRKNPAAMPWFSMNDFMSAFYEDEDTTEITCDVCGTTLTGFKKTGRLGCANCYKVFASTLMPVIKGIHMSTKHTGKHPGECVAVDISKPPERESKSERLKKELKDAVAVENFEEAARLRDEIALLDKEDD